MMPESSSSKNPEIRLQFSRRLHEKIYKSPTSFTYSRTCIACLRTPGNCHSFCSRNGNFDSACYTDASNAVADNLSWTGADDSLPIWQPQFRGAQCALCHL